MLPLSSPLRHSRPRAAAEVHGPAAGQRFVPGLAIHVGDHQHLAGRRVLGDGGDETVGAGKGGRWRIAMSSLISCMSAYRQHIARPLASRQRTA